MLKTLFLNDTENKICYQDCNQSEFSKYISKNKEYVGICPNGIKENNICNEDNKSLNIYKINDNDNSNDNNSDKVIINDNSVINNSTKSSDIDNEINKDCYIIFNYLITLISLILIIIN